MITSVVILMVGWSFFSVYPMKSLLLLEFLYLVLIYLLMEFSLGSWWLMLIILFSACESVFLLTVYMIMGVTIGKNSLVKFYVW